MATSSDQGFKDRVDDTIISSETGASGGTMDQTVVAAEGSVGQDTSATAKDSVIGDFRIVNKLGQGGMGAVYLAHQISLDRACALKVMARELASKPGFVERFVREARSMARMQHPHVVSCYAVGEDKGTNYVAMELIDGLSMQVWLNQLKVLSVPDALLVTIVVAEALQHAHDLKMIHRDIKPDNILLTRSGIIKVADLGLAKATDEDMSMTQSGMGLGTPHYMPPEQARNAKHVDHRCDVYALGVTLYHFVTGKVPFSGDSVIDLITNKEKGTFTAAHRVDKKIPERLSLMIDRAMAKEPKSRYQSMTEFVKDLRSLGLASTSLSFIEGAKAPASASAAPARTPAKPVPVGRGTAVPPQMPTEALPADANAAWYVKVVKGGKPAVVRMTTGQILAAVKTDKLDSSAQLAQSAKGPFLPLPQAPAFLDATRKMVARQQANAGRRSLADEYSKLEKQYDRRKWWQMLARFREGTLGLVGFALYLAAVGAIILGLFYFAPTIYQLIASKLKLPT